VLHRTDTVVHKGFDRLHVATTPSKPTPQTHVPHKLWGGPALLLLGPTMSHVIEEPAYEVVQKLGKSVEIRRYTAYVVAEVLIAGPVDEAGNQAFPILAGYIFGKNKGERKFAMTAPVTQTSAPTKFAMTAPVTQSAAEGGRLVSFVLPKDVTLTTAPEPIDERVKLREVAGHTLAAIRYSGSWSQANDAEHLAELTAALGTAKLSWAGEPVVARYNGPWTPWFLRRNELWLQLP